MLKNRQEVSPCLAVKDFHQVLDSLTTSVVVIDDQFQIIFLNNAAQMLFKISFDPKNKILISDCFKESAKALETLKKAVHHGYFYTKRKACWELSGQRMITVDYTVTPLPDGRQAIIEIQSLDRLLKISREEALLNSQETTRSLVRGLAHEVKNPLGGIRGAAQLLQHELSSQSIDGLNEYTQVIIDEADRLRNLVDRLLGPSQRVNLKQVNPHELLERVALLINAQTQYRIKIIRDYDPSIPDIEGDKELLIQAILNIFRNAVEALEEQQIENASITIATRVHRQLTIGRVRHPLVCGISICDNGPGIDENLIESIFVPMISGRAEGTGLGLAISQQIINQHNGVIECMSKPGETCFSIYLPLESS